MSILTCGPVFGVHLIEEFIKAEIREAIAVAVDKRVLFGQGASNEPLGIANTPGIGVVTFGGAANWTNILAVEKALADQNADVGALGWAVSTATRNRWKNISRIPATNYPVFIMEADTVNDYPAVASTQLSGTDQAMFGNWNDLYILIWGDGLDFVVDPVTQAGNGKAIITATLWFNSFALHPQSFCLSADSAAQ
jgi:HK97 family phage major capsid protein